MVKTDEPMVGKNRAISHGVYQKRAVKLYVYILKIEKKLHFHPDKPVS